MTTSPLAARPLLCFMNPTLGLLLAASCALPAAATPVAHDIVKCIDRTGRVTLTDMDCGSGARKVTLVKAAMPDPAAQAADTAPAPQAMQAALHKVMATPEHTPSMALSGAALAHPAERTAVPAVRQANPVRQPIYRARYTHAAQPSTRPTAGLARDVATLKAARKAFKLLDQASDGARLAHR